MIRVYEEGIGRSSSFTTDTLDEAMMQISDIVRWQIEQMSKDQKSGVRIEPTLASNVFRLKSANGRSWLAEC